MKRIPVCLLAAALVLQTAPAAQAVDTCASCAVVMDAASGRVLYEKAAHERRLIASITKLMTALVALESGHTPDERVVVPEDWTGVEGSSIYLRPGEELTLEALLYGLLLHSGNDAAQVIADHCGGTAGEFVSAMNQKAAELDMDDSSFANPSGLDHPEHYSTAYDMALLARACLENDFLAKVVSTKQFSWGGRVFVNHNKLLWRYEGCIGLKTGYTEKAGRTLVSAATRDGLTLICVTLNCPNDWAEHAALLDDAFARYNSVSLAGEELLCTLPVKGSLVPFCPIVAERALTAAVKEEEAVKLELRLEQKELTAPVCSGTVVGQAVWTLEGRELASVRLLTGAAVKRDEAEPETPWKRIKTWLADRSA